MAKKRAKQQRPKKPKFKTLAEGFEAAAAEKQYRLDMHAKLAERLRKP